MQHKKINITYLIDEMLRKWRMIVTATVILALLVAGFSYMSAKNQATAVKYGAYLHIRISYNPVFEELKDDEGIAERDFSDEIEAIIISDAVMDSVAAEITASGTEISSDSVRSTLYVGYDKYGNNVYVDVLTSNQDMSIKIASSFSDKSKNALESNGYAVEIVRHVSEKGPVTIKSKEISTGKFQYVTTALSYSDVSAGLIDLIKGGLFGALAGAFIMATIVCVRFILRDPVVHIEQIKNMGKCTVIGEINDDIQRCVVDAINVLFIKNPKLKRINCMGFGELRNEVKLAITEDLSARKVEVKWEDAKAVHSQVDETLLVICSYSISVCELNDYCNMLNVDNRDAVSLVLVK